MALVMDWLNYIITVPKADMTLVATTPSEIRQLNIDDFRLELRDIEDSIAGIPQPVTHEHQPPLTSSGVTYARIVTILAPYTIEFEDGLYNVNIVGGNSNIADVVIKNQVGVNTSNSAGLQDASSLQAASFLGYVAVDVTSSNTGTTFPTGTREFPVNNIADAHLIAVARGLNELRFLGDATIATEDWSGGFHFSADSPVNATLTLGGPADLSNCQFSDVTVTGTLDGTNTFRRCHIQDVNFFNGAMHECSVEGSITTGGTELVEIYDSWSGVPGGGAGQTPVLSIQSANDLVIRNWSGGLEIQDCLDTVDGSIDLASGRVTFDSTCIDGTFTVRGVGKVTDNSVGATVTDDTVSTGSIADAVWNEPASQHENVGSFGERAMLMEKILRNKTVTDPVAGTITVYDDDGVSVLLTASLWENVAGTTQYDGNGADRRDRLA